MYAYCLCNPVSSLDSNGTTALALNRNLLVDDSGGSFGGGGVVSFWLFYLIVDAITDLFSPSSTTATTNPPAASSSGNTSTDNTFTKDQNGSRNAGGNTAGTKSMQQKQWPVQ